ncbi:hypothetical protein [Pseudomonas fontis]|uniref:Uncharacterized protein n=1 Tax=Pseudomonas fontis TaxID=2942633 RepID=A0ABT5NXM4_9PSED|nr:hypothetical protein [Pseudomonas fontis]MDD0973784.1 hypothetical protein [Pseudomonas fontis]MDD0992918.1 hypothetical protein [Pseudomonas fontis]
MPLIQGCSYQNPVSAGLPAIPNAAGAPNLAPIQGDHIFGDVIGAIETALQQIFGGGANWQMRMRSFNPTLATLWQGLDGVDFGHSANPPITQRVGVPEPDEHSHMFGGYSRRLQWHLCKVVCTGFAGGVEQRRIGGATRAWRNNVLASFDDLINHLVDSTALGFYIATPGGVRMANAAAVRHVALSLGAARINANGNMILAPFFVRYDSLRGTLEGLLQRFDGSTKTFLASSSTWI